MDGIDGGIDWIKETLINGIGELLLGRVRSFAKEGHILWIPLSSISVFAAALYSVF